MLNRKKMTKDDNLVFLHVPKTGGTTLTHILLKIFPEELVCPARHWYTAPNWKIQKSRKPLSDLDGDITKYKFFTGHFLYDMVNFLEEKPILITILRHPVSRVVSVYNYIKSLDDHPLRTEVDKMSLEEFAEWNIPDRPFENKNRYVHDIGAKLNISSPSDIPLVAPDLDNIFDSAQKRLNKFDFVGITERFNESVLLLSYILGIPLDLTYEKYKVTPKSNFQDVPSSRALSIIEKNNAQDIALYNDLKHKFETQWDIFVKDIILS